MLQGVVPAIPPDSVRETVAAVFAQSDYYRPLRRSVWQYVVGVWNDAVRMFFTAFRDVPWVKWLVIGTAAIVIATIIARMLFVRKVQHSTTISSRTSSFAGDPSTVARGHAAAGRYLDAVHALYLALLESLARTDRLTLDPAKTVGDYSRELRAASSRTLPVFRDFARVYEPVVWGSRDCDQKCYDTLTAIAERVVK